MPIKQAPILKYAFGEKGDRMEFAVEPDPQGNMSWAEGYPAAFSKNPEEDGKYILRDNFNYMQFLISQGVRDMQVNGGRMWDLTSANVLGGYPAGARVLVWYDLSTNQITQNPTKDTENFYLASTIPLVSMVDNNIYSPFEDNNLFKYWLIDDGAALFDIKIQSQNISADFNKIPSGYIDLGDSEVSSKKYNFNDFVRVRYFKDRGKLPNFINDNKDNTFSLIDIRGYFMRHFSNGSTIDSGRAFNTLQSDRIRNITGKLQGEPGSRSWGFANLPVATSSGAITAINTGESLNYPGNGTRRYLNGFTFDASKSVPTGQDNAPYNFNVKLYLKV